MPYYHTCALCGANLDPGERCDCAFSSSETKTIVQSGSSSMTNAKKPGEQCNPLKNVQVDLLLKNEQKKSPAYLPQYPGQRHPITQPTTGGAFSIPRLRPLNQEEEAS